MASIPNLSRIPSGPQLPGAYPLVPDQQEEKVAESPSLLDTAKQYIPESAQQALTNAGQTAKSYLPASVAAYIPGTAAAPAPLEHAVRSLPTHEEQGAKPYEHSDGVGALPGNVSQEEVAKLPEEMAVEKSRVENEGRHETAVPSHKSEGADGKGEQELEGGQSLAANKTLNPEPAYLSPRSPEKQQPPSEDAESSKSRHAHADQPAHPSVPSYTPSSAQEHEKPQPPKPIEKDDTPTAPVSILKNPLPQAAYMQNDFGRGSAAPYDTTADALDHGNGHVRNGSGDSTDVHRKVSLKDRIRGEAKVVMGKLGNKEEKVQEGKRILSGIAQP